MFLTHIVCWILHGFFQLFHKHNNHCVGCPVFQMQSGWINRLIQDPLLQHKERFNSLKKNGQTRARPLQYLQSLVTLLQQDSAMSTHLLEKGHHKTLYNWAHYWQLSTHFCNFSGSNPTLYYLVQIHRSKSTSSQFFLTLHFPFQNCMLNYRNFHAEMTIKLKN